MHYLNFGLDVFLLRYDDVLYTGANNETGTLFSYRTHVVKNFNCGGWWVDGWAGIILAL